MLFEYFHHVQFFTSHVVSKRNAAVLATAYDWMLRQTVGTWLYCPLLTPASVQAV